MAKRKPAAGQTTADIIRELEACYEPENLYLRTVGSVLDAADLLDVPHEVKLILSQPKNEIMVHCPVRMDDGRWELFKG